MSLPRFEEPAAQKCRVVAREVFVQGREKPPEEASPTLREVAEVGAVLWEVPADLKR